MPRFAAVSFVAMQTSALKANTTQDCNYYGCTSTADCSTYPASVVCGASFHCDMQWGATGKCQLGPGVAELEAQQTCAYYGCTSTADCGTYPASVACGASYHCDMQWGATGKCQLGPGAAKLEAQQTCAYYGCTGDADCGTYPASTVCGSNPRCDMRWGATGKCYAAGAELESKQTCDYYGCTGDADCGTYPASTVCGSNPRCDMRWGATGKCYAAGAELEAKQTCDYYGCTGDADCGTYPASTVCGSNPRCDMRWGATGKCYSAGVELEAKQTCDYYGCTGDADCGTYPASTVCGSNPRCDMRWGATGKCYAAGAELEAKQTCDYYGCTGDADCGTYPASTVCGSTPRCDMRWGATGKCYAAGASLMANASSDPSTNGYCVSTSPSNPCGRCYGESYCGNNVIGVYYCRYPKDSMCPSEEEVMV